MFNDDEDDESINPQLLPIYRKGEEIMLLTLKITALIPDTDEIQSHLKAMMLQDAALLTVKVSGAEAADLYDIRMENATIVRKAARELLTHCTSLEMFNFKETHYLQLIREAVEEYRLLFIDWVNSFDPWNYILDDWGLFNPPGIKPEQ
ncbi:MAG TPA: hypothetical protein VIG72_12240 [Pontibacter sp.]